MAIKEITSEDFDSEVKEFKGKVLVDFVAPWCAGCRGMAPTIGMLASCYKDVKFIEVDVEKRGDIAINCEVQALPTLIIFDNGVEVFRHSGPIPAPTLEIELKKEHQESLDERACSLNTDFRGNEDGNER
jgi:thioredoxin 1